MTTKPSRYTMSAESLLAVLAEKHPDADTSEALSQLARELNTGASRQQFPAALRSKARAALDAIAAVEAPAAISRGVRTLIDYLDGYATADTCWAVAMLLEKGETQPVLDDRQILLAPLIAMVVRNAIEGFHSEHLNDTQMAELNPIVRNAIATALHAIDHQHDEAAERFLAFQQMLIPGYWEPVELLDSYVELWDRD